MDPSSCRCLLLNSTYEPLRTISWQRAILLVWSRKVEVVEEYALRVSSPTVSLPLPAVVRIKTYIQAPRKTARFCRRNLYYRDRGICQYCGLVGSLPEMTVDHVIPRSRGGAHRWENVALACARCNRAKGARTPEEAGMALLRPPFRPRWLAAGAGVDPRDTPEQWERWLRAA